MNKYRISKAVDSPINGTKFKASGAIWFPSFVYISLRLFGLRETIAEEPLESG